MLEKIIKMIEQIILWTKKNMQGSANKQTNKFNISHWSSKTAICAIVCPNHFSKRRAYCQGYKEALAWWKKKKKKKRKLDHPENSAGLQMDGHNHS